MRCPIGTPAPSKPSKACPGVSGGGRNSYREEPRDRYASDFRDGAIVYPRLIFTVNRVDAGRFGTDPEAPVVESRRTNQEKPPWKTVASLRGNIEAQFVRPLYLGESIAPFRVLWPILSIIPWDETEARLLDSDSALRSGFGHLGEWLAQAERLLAEHGSGKRTLTQQLDYYGQLSAQDFLHRH